MSDMTKAPRDFESLRSVIILRKDSLPRRLAQVAAFALTHPDDIAFGTAASIASAADVQPSTLVRLAHHLGFDGFSDLQSVFRDRLKDRTSSYEERLQTLETHGTQTPETELLHGFLASASHSLQRLTAMMDGENFRRAIACLGEADMLYLVAKRRAYPLTAHMAYAFGKLNIRHQAVASPNGIDSEIVRFARPRDAAIAISFSPYASETVAQTEMLAAAKIPIVAITDSAFSPLATLATHWFEVAESDFAGFRSLSASMALSMAIPVAVAEYRRKKGRGQV